MTDKLKCPFCGTELEEFGGGDFPLLHYCDNINCNLYHIMGQYTLWQALIDSKKAQDALNVARNLYQELALAYCEMVDDYRTTYGCLKTPEQETQEYMKEYDEKIASITKQEI